MNKPILNNNNNNRNSKKNWPQKLATLALFATPIFLLAYYFTDHPYKAEIARRTVNLSQYSREQRLNFITAARAIDGTVIAPGQTFSFNAKVGPRTGSRGFVPAGSYLGGSRVSSEGGGICLISSCLYQTALLSGLKIKERAAHTTCVRSVPPGLDATVWYGKADLKLVNTYEQPVQIRCQTEAPEELIISIVGTDEMKIQAKNRQLRRRELAFDGRNLLVEVYLDGDRNKTSENKTSENKNNQNQNNENNENKNNQNKNNLASLISRDSYRLP